MRKTSLLKFQNTLKNDYFNLSVGAKYFFMAYNYINVLGCNFLCKEDQSMLMNYQTFNLMNYQTFNLG